MVATPYIWVSWSDARRRMAEIWVGWGRDFPTADGDKAMVNSLRRGNVFVRGGAHKVNARWSSIPLPDVVGGLLSVTLSFVESVIPSSAEYETTELVMSSFARLEPALYQVKSKEIAQLSDVELAWDQFRDDLIQFELPKNVLPNRDLAEPPANRTIGTTAQAASSARKQARLAYKHRVADFQRGGGPPPLETTKAGVQGDRDWAVKNRVSRNDITKWRQEFLGTQARGRPRNSATKIIRLPI